MTEAGGGCIVRRATWRRITLRSIWVRAVMVYCYQCLGFNATDHRIVDIADESQLQALRAPLRLLATLEAADDHKLTDWLPAANRPVGTAVQ